MLRIHRYSDQGVVFSLSGRLETEHVEELQKLLSLEAVGQGVSFDLEEITLVHRDAVRFLARCEAGSVRLENCPPFIREWIDLERGGSRHRKSWRS
jgi:hypothetical protein